MDFDGIGTMALFLSSGAVGVGLIILAGYRMRLKAEIEKHRLGASGSTSDLDDLRDEMRETLAQQATQIDELHERLDFSERLLARGKPDELAGDS